MAALNAWGLLPHDPVARSVYTRVSSEKMAERIDVMFGVETLGDPRNIEFGGRRDGDSMRLLPNYFGHLFCLLTVVMVTTTATRVRPIKLGFTTRSSAIANKPPDACAFLPMFQDVLSGAALW